MKIYLSVEMPEQLVESFFRAIRKWDEKADPFKTNQIVIETYTANDWPVKEKLELMKKMQPDFFMVRGKVD